MYLYQLLNQDKATFKFNENYEFQLTTYFVKSQFHWTNIARIET